MAKGSTLLDGTRKKIGNMIAYRITGSNNKVKTGFRIYNPEITNPKTLQQANQRLRIPVAQNFYRAYRDLLDHSWQGTAYKARSYNKFLQLAMGDKDAIIPYVAKGEKRFFPAGYLMSVGGIPAVQVFPMGSDDWIETNLEFEGTLAQHSTWGEICASILSTNLFLRNGDWLTFVEVDNVNGDFVPLYLRKRIDVRSTEAITTASKIYLREISEGYMQVAYSLSNSQYPPVAGCVIVSREPAARSRAWQRSTTRLELAVSYKQQYCSESAYQEAVITYMSQDAEVNADWYLNGGSVNGQSTPFTNPLGLENGTTIVQEQSVQAAKFANNPVVAPYGKYLIKKYEILANNRYQLYPIILQGATLKVSPTSYVLSSQPSSTTFITYADCLSQGVDFSGYIIDTSVTS